MTRTGKSLLAANKPIGNQDTDVVDLGDKSVEESGDEVSHTPDSKKMKFTDPELEKRYSDMDMGNRQIIPGNPIVGKLRFSFFNL